MDLDKSAPDPLIGLMTVQEASELLQCTPASIYIAINQHRIAAQSVLGRIVLCKEDVVKYGKTLGRANGWNARKPKPNPMKNENQKPGEHSC
jgi:excisionase family DNA binding protein